MDMIQLVIIYAVVLGGLWFLLMRPQKKEQKRLQLMLSEIDVGEQDVIVEFGSNKNCRIPMQKSAIMQVEKQASNS